MDLAAPGVVSSPGEYDFYRCRNCFRLLTGRGIEERLRSGIGTFCPCGSEMIKPCAPPAYAVFLPRVWPLLLERARVLGWRGLRENWRADRVAKLLEGMPKPVAWSSGVPSTGAEGPVILASNQNLARVLGRYVEYVDPEPDAEGKVQRRPIAVGNPWVGVDRPLPVVTPPDPLRELL